MNPSETAPASREQRAEPGKVKVVAIDETLHALLKARAAREGKSLQSLVETKLRELEEVPA